MRKIPTLFKRDPENMKYVLPEVHPGCQWVLDGEGVPTRKYDGTCVFFDGVEWWARREVKAGKAPPPRFEPVEADDNTGKTVGWEPIGQSSFAKFHAEAVAADDRTTGYPGTYELVGPKINGNPEGADYHQLIEHAMAQPLTGSPRDFEGLREWLLNHDFEGIVWHHPDGRMAKLKVRDFPAVSGVSGGEQ